MASTKYAAAGMESEFQPGSRGRVLRNFLGITQVREMEAAESQALEVAQETALSMGPIIGSLRPTSGACTDSGSAGFIRGPVTIGQSISGKAGSSLHMLR
jgi:hypothetical protein